MKRRLFTLNWVILAITCLNNLSAQQNLVINDKGYFEKPGLNVMVFSDIYPEGHQTGVTIVQHGERVAANGDLRLEPSPGQWSPMPKCGEPVVDKRNQAISVDLYYPDSSRNRTGFNPIDYPQLILKYKISVHALENNSFKILVDLDEPLPEKWVGKVGFNFELFPEHLFGKSFIMDGQPGLFQPQPSGPVINWDDESIAMLAQGKKLVIAPEEDKQRMTIESSTNDIELLDGRANHNNGWYIVRGEIPGNVTKNALEWTITPNVVSDWMYDPVIQLSQIGYYPKQSKRVIIEQDIRDTLAAELSIYKITMEGKKVVVKEKPSYWGKFLRYNYFTYDFSIIEDSGLYVIDYRGKTSNAFRIDNKIYDHGVWQPVLEYFLPVQMCHMRVNEKYRVWHGACHLDDALMAPVDTNHFDGYIQGHSTLSKYKPYEHVPDLNRGGWHDAGDYDLRVESQLRTIWSLALMVEEFGLSYDATLIEQENRIVEIHTPDGKSDAIQQIEHGLLSVLGAYRSLGRLYRGIICHDKRQYVLLGDGSTMTDNVISLEDAENSDDRWVFTKEDVNKSLLGAGCLAAAYRVLKEANPELADECISTAQEIWSTQNSRIDHSSEKIFALSELILATSDIALKRQMVNMKDIIIKNIDTYGWEVVHVIHKIDDQSFKEEISNAAEEYINVQEEKAITDSPYGVPYEPNIWGAGWSILSSAVEKYFFHKAWPEFVSVDFYANAINFVLGVHPGRNTASFVSGVGANSVLVAYGTNRAEWSYIPGGVVSGTALIRPDLPELKTWPFFWQQTEYVMGEGSNDYMFLVLAVQEWFAKNK